MFENIKEPVFTSVFAEICKKFIEYKRNLGYRYNVEAYLMEQFDQLAVTYKIKEPILTKDLVYTFVKKNLVRPENP